MISLQTENEQDKMAEEKFGGNIEVCGADSFMLRDGVCDELTNNETCHYDGGDCCLDRDQKDTTLCRVTLDLDMNWFDYLFFFSGLHL